jgi:cytochrome b
VGLHVAAVIVESRRLGVNLPKSMITGYKTLPDPGSDA